MADIHQWRRKILPRSRTPTAEQEERSFTSTTTSTSSTPNRRSRPKLTSLLSHSHAPPPIIISPSLASVDWTNQSTPPKLYCPDVMLMAQVIMSKLLENTHEGLSPNYNSQVMHIIEAYRNVDKEKEELVQELTELEDKMSLLKNHAQDLAARLTCQRKEHRIEVERLQSLLATASAGLSDSPDTQSANSQQTAAVSFSAPNQHSQTIPKVVKWQTDSNATKTYDKTLHGPQTHQSPTDQATFPSAFVNRPNDLFASTEAIHHSRRLMMQPFKSMSPPTNATISASSTPIRFQSSCSSPRKSRMRRHASKLSLASTTGKPEIMLSEDNYSTFSSNGDAFSDEVSNNSDTMNLAYDKDFDAIRCLAEVMARRQGIGLDEALSKLTDIFFSNQHPEMPPMFSSKPAVPHLTPKSSLLARQLASTSFNSYPFSAWPGHEKALSGIFENEQPFQASSQADPTTNRLYRPFSFTLGDDRDVEIFQKERGDQPGSVSTTEAELQFPTISNTPEVPAPVTNKVIASLGLSKSSPNVTAPPAIRKYSTGSQIPVLRSASNQPSSMERLRENSTSSVGTIIQRSPANVESKNASVSRPDSVRTSSLQSIMNGLRADRYSTSAASSLRTSSTSSGKKKASGRIEAGSLLSDDGKVVAIAAARAAGERGGSQQ